MESFSAHEQSLRHLFAGLTEHTFMAEMGLTDLPLVDYLSGLLTRFVHRDKIFAVADGQGRTLEQLAQMMVEAEREERQGNPRREIYRHMGDYALFWTGVYPESLQTRTHRLSQDAVLDYLTQGKRSYYIASMYADTPTYAQEAPVLRRLSDRFELCALGLRKVRAQWEHAA